MIQYFPFIFRNVASLLIYLVVLFPLPGQAGIFEYFRDLFSPPSPSETAGSNRSGGARDECPSKELPLTALVPQKNRGKTVEPNPTLWFYVPYTAQDFASIYSSNSKPMEFVLIEVVEEGIEQGYQLVNLDLPEQPGLFPVQISEDTPLDVGRRYRWVLSIHCNPNNRSADATVNGWIERVELNDKLQAELASTSSPEERIRTYGRHGLWYDMLTALLEYHDLDNPQNESEIAIRDELFGFVGLCQLTTEPPVEYCSPEE